MIEDLALTQNAQFFRASEPITDEGLKRLLDAASEDAIEGEPFLSDELRVSGQDLGEPLEFRYSLRVFYADRPVYFLPKTGYRDRVCAFILVLEIDGYLVIMKRGCSNISVALERLAVPVGSEQLSATISQDAAYQKLNVRNMTVSEAALRARSYEAANLEGLLSLHAAGRSIPYFVRVRTREGLSSLGLSSSRLFDASDRVTATEVAVWAKKKIASFYRPGAKSRFLSAFAKNVDLNDVLSRSEPTSILIESGVLSDYLDSRDLSMFYIDHGVRKPLPVRVCRGVVKRLEKVYEIDATYKIVGARARLKRNKASLSFSSRLLQWIHVEYEGRTMTLQAFIIKKQMYSICFDEPKYMYFMGGCFEDVSGISEIDELLRILKPKPDLLAAIDEKGELDSTKTAFQDSSVFGIVERLHQQDDFIFCDDLGNEWADHITLDESVPAINFIHSKFGVASTSASQLHHVVSQGIKNLGNMFFANQLFMRKYNNKFRKVYSGTRIQRIRKSGHPDVEQALVGILRSYKLQRRCILACSFISKKAVTREFGRVKAGYSVPGHVVQLLWILSSFAHATREMSVEPRIYCLP